MTFEDIDLGTLLKIINKYRQNESANFENININGCRLYNFSIIGFISPIIEYSSPKNVMTASRIFKADK